MKAIDPAAGAATARQPAVIPTVCVSLLLAAAHLPALLRMAQTWRDEPEMSHGFLVPIVAGYALWTRRQQFVNRERRVDWRGLCLVILGGLLVAGGMAVHSQFLMAVAFQLSLLGVVFYLHGAKRLAVALTPLGLLLFAILPPVVLYDRLTGPLQAFSSWAAESVLDALGCSVLREGNVLHFHNFSLMIAEACSGLGGLFSLTFFGAAWACILETNARVRPLILLYAIPAALFGNILRIVLTGALGTFNPAWTEGLIHAATGWLTLSLGLACLTAMAMATGALFAHRT
jgi:exosortase